MESMDRTILHCDCNSYYASVECLDHPQWRTVPMAVCGDPQSRHGIILAKNELAKACGVQTAQTIWQAKQCCPNLLLVPPRFPLYAQYSKKINEIYAQYTDQVEPFSIDESWLDVTGSLHLFGSGEQIADELRRRIRQELGLTISVGVSFNKTYAKLGSDYKKPDATTVISRENYRQILWPLPVRDMLFVGASAARKLQQVGILTIGDLVHAGAARMYSLLGRAGESIWKCASGSDDSLVKRIGERESVKSISNSCTFGHDLVQLREIRKELLNLCDRAASRLREKELFCGVVQLQIKDRELQTMSRQKSLVNLTQSTQVIYETTLSLLEENWQTGRPIRMLSVGVVGLTPSGSAQMSLFEDDAQNEKRLQMEKTMDAIRNRFGKSALVYGAVMETESKGKEHK